MSTRRDLRSLGIAVAAALSTLSAAAPARADWQWSFTPYFWASELGADASVNDKEVLETEVDLADVVDNLDFAIQAHLEGQNGRHGLFLDVTYIDMGDDDKVYDFGGPLGGTLVAKGDLETTILEAGGIFNPRGDGTGFALLYGARVLDFDQEVDARIEFLNRTVASRRYEASKTLVDALIGARVLQPINDRWSFLLRADASAGGSELAWNAQTGFGYSFGRKPKTLFVGYRYMEIEFEEKDARAELELQNKLGGFVAGLRMNL
jgi:hypothetical protein